MTATTTDTARLSVNAQRVELLTEAVGGPSRLADLLHVNKSQPTRWRAGQPPSPEIARRVVDLDHIIARAQLLWEPEVALVWLRSSNGHLDGARPIDVLSARGPAEVLDALDATASGAFA